MSPIAIKFDPAPCYSSRVPMPPACIDRDEVPAEHHPMDTSVQATLCRLYCSPKVALIGSLA